MSIASLPASTALELFAISAPGLESCLGQELKTLCPDAMVKPQPEGCTVIGTLSTLYKLNLWSRLATRVLLRIGTVRALHFPELVRKVAALPWTEFARSPVRVRVSATAHRCRLIHTGALAERVELALLDAGLIRTDEESAPLLHVFIRGESDHFTLSVDTSGELLHRRGYRLEDGGAPLRETLAPGLLALAGYDSSIALCDPMCGSATLAIEAALVSGGRAPGIGRRFAFFDWPGFSSSLWQALLAEAQAQALPTIRRPIWASDRDPQVIGMARRNAERAGVLDLIEFQVCAVDKLRLPSVESGLILTNPPYGKRLRERHLVETYRALGQLRRRSPGFRLAVFSPDAKLATAAGASRLVGSLRNGGLRVGLFSSVVEQSQAAATPS